jgi:hypothetical protein
MNMDGEKDFGRTINGELITDELIERLVQEAEEGWDVGDLIRRGQASASPPLSNDQVQSPRSKP